MNLRKRTGVAIMRSIGFDEVGMMSDISLNCDMDNEDYVGFTVNPDELVDLKLIDFLTSRPNLKKVMVNFRYEYKDLCNEIGVVWEK